MTEKQFTAIEEQVQEATQIGQLDEIAETLFDDYFKSGKQANIKKLHNIVVKKINKQLGWERLVEITDSTKPPRIVNGDEEAKPKKNALRKNMQIEENLFGSTVVRPKNQTTAVSKILKATVEEDLFGEEEEELFANEEDLFGEEKPKPKQTKKAPTGKPNTGQRIKALVAKKVDTFDAVVKVLKAEGYTFSENSVRWYISKAKKGEL